MTEPRLPPLYRLIAFDLVESTNDEARRLAAEGAGNGTLVWAKEQSKGRGRQGRRFVSPPGNLYMSLIVRPEKPPREAAQLSFVTALALGDAVGSVAPPMIEVHYKWPNDVLFNGRKGSGILLETEIGPCGTLEWLVIGLGVNVRSFPLETSFPATSLHFEGGDSSVTEVGLLESFARHFQAWVSRWLDDGFAPLRRTWLQHAYRLGETVEIRLPHETLTGRFADLDETGALVVERPDGTTRLITAGDPYFPSDA